MHRRQFMKQSVALSVAFLSSRGGAGAEFTELDSPSGGEFFITKGMRLPISSFHTDALTQPGLLAALQGEKRMRDGARAAIFSSVDQQRVLLYGGEAPLAVKAAAAETHDYEVVYVKAGASGFVVSQAVNGVGLINTFATSPDRQQQLVDIWVEAAPRIEGFPGFLGAALHRSSDGASVVNYAQWRTREDWWAMARNQAAKFREKNPFGSADPHIYTVAAIL